ncbi:MAG: SIS domain-containing protein [Candidatus Hodarchaeales archaeon]
MKNEEDLLSFYSAFEVLTQTTKKTVQAINEYFSPLDNFCNYLSTAKEENNTIHFVGMGRSGKIAMLFGEMLKNIGFRVSIIGKSLARPVNSGDVVCAITGSGWTTFVTNALELSIKKQAKILVITGAEQSKAARLADEFVLLPQGYRKERLKSFFHAPLTPMGTIFELMTLVVATGIVFGVDNDNHQRGFNEGVNELISSSKMTFANFTKNNEVISETISIFEDYMNQPRKKVYFFGSGIDAIIATIASIRFVHLKINVKSTYDWRFRRKGDLLVAISGSGISTRTLERVMSAESSNMKIISLTSFPDSIIAKKSDIIIELAGRDHQYDSHLLQINELDLFTPAFEYVAALYLDSCVAQMANDLGITEESMRAEHANIE